MSLIGFHFPTVNAVAVSSLSSPDIVAPDPSPAVNPPTIKPGYKRPQADAGLMAIVARLKNELKSRGGNGFIALQRKFRIMDDDGNVTTHPGTEGLPGELRGSISGGDFPT